MADERRGESVRRASDEALELLKVHIAKDEELQAKILVKLTDMHDMLKVFNSIKGFWFTCKWIAIISVGVVSFAGSVAAIGYAIKTWVKT